MGGINPINFETWCNNINPRKDKIKQECLNTLGAKTQDEVVADYKVRIAELNEESFEILPESWRALAGKSNPTKAEQEQIAKDYQQGFLNFGNAYVTHLDKTYGNGDGKLTMDEFVKSENGEDGAKNFFKNTDLNKSGNIDGKEMAALMAMFDCDVHNGGINGKIKIYDMNSCSLSMGENPDSKYGKAIGEKLRAMYEFLFPSK